jgi:ABC-type nitrate/sulfonate/bicarbonate transport system substrate-binding protein
MNRREAIIGAAVTAGAAILSGRASAETRLTIMVFPGLSNLPLFAAQQRGFFAKRDLAVEIKYAPNSDEQRAGLADGRFQIVHSAADNAVALVEAAKVDAAIFIGGDDSFNHLFVAPGITSYADIKGKTVLVDAPNTAYAFQLYAMLKQHGLAKGDYTVKSVGGTTARLKGLQDGTGVAAMMSPPFSIRGAREGLKDMGSAVQALGAYQAGSGFVLRSWAQANQETLLRYLQAYIEGLRWALDPANKDAAIRLYVDHLHLPQDIAAQSYDIVARPAGGLAVDGAFDMDGFRNVLKLRAEFEGGPPLMPEKYLDLTYYRKALATM